MTTKYQMLVFNIKIPVQNKKYLLLTWHAILHITILKILQFHASLNPGKNKKL